MDVEFGEVSKLSFRWDAALLNIHSMDDAQRQEIKDKILDEIISIEARIEELEELTKPIAPDKSLGRLTRLEAMQNKGVNEDALNRARQTLTRLNMAYTQVLTPGFGRCAGCGNAIPLERILAMPQSTLCVNCAS